MVAIDSVSSRGAVEVGHAHAAEADRPDRKPLPPESPRAARQPPFRDESGDPAASILRPRAAAAGFEAQRGAGASAGGFSAGGRLAGDALGPGRWSRAGRRRQARAPVSSRRVSTVAALKMPPTFTS